MVCYLKPHHPLHFKTTAVQGSRSKKWLSNYRDWKSCPRIEQYFPVLAGSALSLKITKWICWVETYEESLNPEHYSLRKRISPEPSFLRLSNNTLMFGLVIAGSTQLVQRILQCICSKWLQFRKKPSVSLHAINRVKRQLSCEISSWKVARSNKNVWINLHCPSCTSSTSASRNLTLILYSQSWHSFLYDFFYFTL